jgi:hypothetical protein
MFYFHQRIPSYDRDLPWKSRFFLVICEMWVVHNVDVKDSGFVGCYSVPIQRNARQVGMWGISVHTAPRFPFYIRCKRPQWPSLWVCCQQIKRFRGTTTLPVSSKVSLAATAAVESVKKLSQQARCSLPYVTILTSPVTIIWIVDSATFNYPRTISESLNKFR